MRVLILATDIYTRGGVARYTATLAVAMGCLLGPENVDVLALLSGNSPAEPLRGFRLIGTLGNHLKLGSKLRFVLRATRIARQGYDLVIANHVALAPLAAMIRSLYGTSYWVACHGVEVWHRLSMLRRAALSRADLVLAVSRFTAEKLAEINGIAPTRVELLYNAIPNEFVNLLLIPSALVNSVPVEGTRPRFLLSVGNLAKEHEYKGYDMVIRALPKILSAVPEVRYVVVGTGDNRVNLEKLATETGVADRVVFTGEISDVELAALYRGCEIFTLPSRTVERKGSWRGEGFGRVYVEAALAGKPVVGSRAGGAAEAVLHGKTGFLVDPLSVDEIAQAVVTLLQRPGLAASMGAAGRKWAGENFTQHATQVALAKMLHLTSLRAAS